MIFFVILEYALLASTFTLAKKALMYSQPIFLVGFRMITAGLLLLSYLLMFNRESLHIKREDIWLFLKVSLFHIYLAFIFDLWAMQFLTSAKTTIIFSTTPFFAAILSYILIGERLSRGKLLGLALGFLGLVPIIMAQSSAELALGQLFHISTPELALFVAVISACYAWFLIKRLMVKQYSLVLINGFSMLVGGVASLATSFVVEGLQPSPVNDVSQFLVWTGALIVMANIISYNLYGWLLHFYSITFMTFAGLLCPIFGVFFGWFFLNEPITWHYFASLAMISLGLCLFYREELRKKSQ